MKKALVAGFSFGLLVLMYSCTKDQARRPPLYDCTTVDAATNTYNLKIKAILDLKCATLTCHDGDASNLSNVSNVDMHDYASAKNSFQTQDVICAINHKEGCTPMPQNPFQPKLADSLITYLQCWSDNDYPQ